MTTEHTHKTFLSYSRSNKDFAIKLAQELKSEGFDVWLDTLDIPLGSRWDREVERALKESEIFMIILTPNSVGSENVLDEIGYAIDTHKRILPILLENCEVPLRLRRLQYVDFTKKSFDEGVRSAKALLLDLSMQAKNSRGKINAGQVVSAQAEQPGESYKIRNTKEMRYQKKNEEGGRKRKSGRQPQPVPASRTLNKSFPMGLVAIFSAMLLIVVALFFALIYMRLPVLAEQAATDKANPTLIPSVDTDTPSVQPIVNSVLPTSSPTIYLTDTSVPSPTPTITNTYTPTPTLTSSPTPTNTPKPVIQLFEFDDLVQIPGWGIICDNGQQDMTGFGNGLWNDNDQLFVGGKQNCGLTFGLQVRNTGTYKLLLNATYAPDFGIVNLTLVRGEQYDVIHQVDLYASAVRFTGPIDLGNWDLNRRSDNRFVVVVKDKNPKSSNYYFGLDYLSAECVSGC